MLSSSMLREEVDSIVELVAQGNAEEARQRLIVLIPNVSSEYGRGAALALNGILNVIENKSTDRMADRDKILRVTDRIPKSQTLDDLDKGYLQTMAKWAKKTKGALEDAVKDPPKDSANESQS